VARSKSKLGDKKNRHDRFHQAAKKQGFRARSIFKLEEIDQRFDLFRPGARVLDLGCSPGSWLQYAASRVGPAGALVGIDRTLVELAGARTMAGDVFTVEAAELLGELPRFDIVLSDMAPDTTGIRQVDQARSEALFERALDLAVATLSQGGHFVGKLFQGPDFARLVARCRAEFGQVKPVKPESSRQASIEQYVVALGFHAP
jgi:23S rRNA (uridine2552-2'-O)-methyltransferase